MLYNKVEVCIIMIAVSNFEGVGISTKEILLGSISWLREQYEKEKKNEYLQKAVWHIYAYLELGYPFEEGTDNFLPILQYLNMSIEQVFPFDKWAYKKVPLKKTYVRNLLGRWNPVLHSMKIEEVVLDIIDKVSKKKEGIYIYHSGKEIAREGTEILWEYTYRLCIKENGEAIFYDINRNKYYMFI